MDPFHQFTAINMLQVPQCRSCGFAAGVAADHAAALFPTTLALDLVGGHAVLGHALGHADASAVPDDVQFMRTQTAQ